MQRSVVRIASFMLGSGLVACTPIDGPLAANEYSTSSATSLLSKVHDVSALPEARLAVAPSSVGDLTQALSESEGLALVTFKAPIASVRRVIGDGRRAIPASASVAGTRALIAAGVEVLHVFEAVGVAEVRLSPALLAAVMNNPHIERIDPAVKRRSELPALEASQESERPLPTASWTYPTDHVSWNLQVTNAHNVWNHETGENASVLIAADGMATLSDLPYFPTSNCRGLHSGCDPLPTGGGTLSASIIASRANGFNGVGISYGISPNNLHVWKIMLDEYWFSETQVVAALNFAAANGIKVVLLQYVSSVPYQPTADAIAAAIAAGVVVVAPVGGNSNFFSSEIIRYPAYYPGVIGVGGVLENGEPAKYPPFTGCSADANSAAGSMVDFVAPFYGWGSMKVTPSAFVWMDTRTATWCSTAISAAHIAGIVALLRSHFPQLTPAQVFTTLRLSGPHPNAKSAWTGYGVPNALAAVPGTLPPPPGPQVGIAGPILIKPGMSCTYFGSASETAEFTWYIDGVIVGSGPTLEISRTGSFALVLGASPPSGPIGWSTLNVTVSSEASDCYDQ